MLDKVIKAFFKEKTFPNVLNLFKKTTKEKIDPLYNKKNGKDFLKLLYLSFNLKECFYIISHKDLFFNLDYGSVKKDAIFFSMIITYGIIAIFGTFSTILHLSLVEMSYLWAFCGVFVLFLIYSLVYALFIKPVNKSFNKYAKSVRFGMKEVYDQLLKEKPKKIKISYIYCFFKAFKPYSLEYFHNFYQSKNPYTFMLKTFSFYHMSIYLKNVDNIFTNHRQDFEKYTRENQFNHRNKTMLGMGIFFILTINFATSTSSGVFLFLVLSMLSIIFSIYVFLRVSHFLSNRNQYINSKFNEDPNHRVTFFSIHEKTIIQRNLVKSTTKEQKQEQQANVVAPRRKRL